MRGAFVSAMVHAGYEINNHLTFSHTVTPGPCISSSFVQIIENLRLQSSCAPKVQTEKDESHPGRDPLCCRDNKIKASASFLPPFRQSVAGLHLVTGDVKTLRTK